MMTAIEAPVPTATWARMAVKADREGLRAYRLNDDPRSWAVTSGSQDGVAYEVTILDGDLICSCRGSMYHPYCKHRALVLAEIGALEHGVDEGEVAPVPDRVLHVLNVA
jgi:hypothetical protein